MASKLSRFSSRNVPIARPSECSKCGSKFHVSLVCSLGRRPLPNRRSERRPALWMTSSGQAEEQRQDPVYVAKVRALPCIARSIFGHRCLGDVQAHHAGEHAAGRKAPDSTCVPLCMGGHRDLHELRGAFRDYTRVRIRELENRWIQEVQRQLGYTPPSAALAND